MVYHISPSETTVTVQTTSVPENKGNILITGINKD